MKFLFGTSAWQLVLQADLMTKLVLFALFCVSVICVAIIAFKYISFKRQRLKLIKLLSRMKLVKTFTELVDLSKEFKECLGGRFLVSNLAELKDLLGSVEFGQKSGHLSIEDMEFLELAVDQSIDKLILEEEVYLPILGTSAAVSTLVGLFGTVWGLIHAFVSIAQEKSADISVVAPGIAEALTTTLAGLIVAIPATVAFHYFSNELRKLEKQLENVAGRFFNIIRKTFSK